MLKQIIGMTYAIGTVFFWIALAASFGLLLSS